MDKYIILEVVERHKTTVVFRVMEQSHRDDEFGDYSCRFTCDCDGEFSLYSGTAPQLDADDRMLFVRGDSYDADHDMIEVRPELFKTIAIAANCYNNENDSEPRPTIVSPVDLSDILPDHVRVRSTAAPTPSAPVIPPVAQERDERVRQIAKDFVIADINEQSVPMGMRQVQRVNDAFALASIFENHAEAIAKRNKDNA